MQAMSFEHGRNLPWDTTVYIGEFVDTYADDNRMTVKKASVLAPIGSSPSPEFIPITFWKSSNEPPRGTTTRQLRPWYALLTEGQVRQAIREDKENFPFLPEDVSIDVIANNSKYREALALTIACVGLGRAIPTVEPQNLENLPLPERQ
jgi:hypothetical protein